MEEYSLKICGLERKLPIVKTATGIDIAGFNPMGDMELIEKVSYNLVKNIREHISIDEFDIILTTECKGIPFAQEIARLCHKDYVVLRKENKCYLADSHKYEGESITSGHSSYYISENDYKKLQNKNVIFVDDVFSTGKTVDSIKPVFEDTNSNLKMVVVALVEGAEKTEFDYKGVEVVGAGILPLM